MASDQIRIKIFIQVLLLALVQGAGFFLVLKEWYAGLWFVVPLFIFQLYRVYTFLLRMNREVNQFAEAARYRDFSQQFDLRRAPTEVRQLRRNFNEITSVFRNISREKEIQHQYLEKTMELIDTGILLYAEESGEVTWMNDSLRQMIRVPYLKTIRSLERYHSSLYDAVASLKTGGSIVYTLQVDNTYYRILLSASQFRLDGKPVKLVAFKNIHEALDETEARAWQKLLSVMTHEIMNSVAPISSLAETLQKNLQQVNEESSPLDDIRLGIDTIRRRSEGLLKFAETYRNLNKIRTLSLTKVYVRDLFENLLRLMQPSLEQKNISAEIILKDPGLQLDADTHLAEQLLINLMVNAIEAVKEKPDARILLSAEQESGGKIVVKVGDNGVGIPDELIEKIFVPFFTTKKNGSGIGLSLCKQIMLMHKGSIYVQSIEGRGSMVCCVFAG